MCDTNSALLIGPELFGFTGLYVQPGPIHFTSYCVLPEHYLTELGTNINGLYGTTCICHLHRSGRKSSSLKHFHENDDHEHMPSMYTVQPAIGGGGGV